MKSRFLRIYFLLIIQLIFLAKNIPAMDNQDSWDPLSLQKLQEASQKKEDLQRRENLRFLEQAKFYLITGNLGKVYHTLNQVYNPTPKIELVKNRLLSITYFLDQEYIKADELMSDPQYKSYHNYRKTCQFKLLLKLILNRLIGLKEEFESCYYATLSFSRNESFWMENLVKFRLREPEMFTPKTMFNLWVYMKEYDLDSILAWLKLGIFFNKDQSFYNLLPNIPNKSLQSEQVRELIGLLYYRHGKKEAAEQFLEGLETSNSENIRGNWALENKEYEAAWGYFSLALQKKVNSINAIERLIPLSWILQKWERGEELINRITAKGDRYKNKLSLITAFQTRGEKYQEAVKNLEHLNLRYYGKMPKALNQLYSFNALKLELDEKLHKYSHLSCIGLEPINCWILLQTKIWPNFATTLTRKDETYDDKDLSIDELKKEAEINPLQEAVYINQKEIEDLDDRQFQLTY